MEWKIGEQIGKHCFSCFIFLVLFVVVGAFFLSLLEFLEISEMLRFGVFFFLMVIVFFPMAKYWRGKFLNKNKHTRR
jgi:uncharacterized membrane protein